MSFADAAHKTLASHPQFERFALAVRAAQARAEAANLRPPLELSADIENIGSTGAVKGVDGAEITVSLTSVFERGGKRRARNEVAQNVTALLSIEQRIEALDLLAETGRRYIAVASAQEAVIQAQNRANQARRTLERIEPRVAEARSPRTEQLNVEIELASAELAQANAQRELEAARFALAAQWAAPQEAPQEAPVVLVDLYAVTDPRPFEALAGELNQLPDLERFAAEGRVREAELRLVRAQAIADWRWSAGVRRLEDLNEQALVLGFSVPLATRQRSAALVREADLQRAQAPIDAEARRLELLPLLYTHWQQLRNARSAARVIAEEQLPRAREALALTERGYEIGRFPYRELAISQQQVLALEAQRLEAVTQYHLTRIEIERLTGAHLTLIEGKTP